MVSTRICLTACMLIFPSISHAQVAADLTTKMNESQLCSPFQSSLRTLAKLVGASIPDDVLGVPIPDVDLGVDRNHHNVEVFEVKDGVVKIAGTVACQPSDQAVPFKAPFNLDPASLRATDKFECSAKFADGTVSEMDCKTSGEIGKVLIEAIKMNEQMTPIVDAALP